MEGHTLAECEGMENGMLGYGIAILISDKKTLKQE